MFLAIEQILCLQLRFQRFAQLVRTRTENGHDRPLLAKPELG